jgi:hypothetical protein
MKENERKTKFLLFILTKNSDNDGVIKMALFFFAKKYYGFTPRIEDVHKFIEN